MFSNNESGLSVLQKNMKCDNYQVSQLPNDYLFRFNIQLVIANNSVNTGG